jgi:cytochrome P450
VNAWVIHTDENIWGKDVHEFRPERWLVEKEQLAFLDQNYLAVSSLLIPVGIRILHQLNVVLI